MTTVVTTLDRSFSVGTKLTGVAATAVYRNEGTNAAKGMEIGIANTTAGAVTVTVAWHDASVGASYALISGYSLGANTSVPSTLLEVFDGLRLDVNDEVRVTAGTGNAIDVIVTVAEVQGTGR